MTRKDDLETAILDCHQIIRSYEVVLRTSDRAEEKLRARYMIQEQCDLVNRFWTEYRALTGEQPRHEIAQIAAYCSSAHPTFSEFRVYHNLPNPDFTEFIGREEELSRVHDLLASRRRSWVVMIDGVGGVGKTALALEIAHRYRTNPNDFAPENRFDAIVWVSAKREVLTADGIRRTLQDMRKLEDIYAAIAVVLDCEHILQGASRIIDEQIARVLTQQRTLLVIDNLETVDDERINAFLRELPAPTKALVTSRHRLDVANAIRLTGMSKPDALVLISQECAEKGVELQEAQQNRLYERTGGIPLAMVWCIARMGLGHSVRSVLRGVGQPDQDVSRFCFEAIVRSIRGQDAHKIGMALALFEKKAGREALGYAAGFENDITGRDEALVRMERISLVNKTGDRFWLLPLTRSFLENELRQNVAFQRSAFDRMVAYYQQLVRPQVQLAIPYWEGVANHDQEAGFAHECQNLVHVIRLTLERQQHDKALSLFLPIVHALHNWGMWDERLALGQAMCALFQDEPDPTSAWLWIDTVGYMLLKKQAFSACREALAIGKALAVEFDLERAVLLADTFAAMATLDQGDTALAVKQIEAVVQRAGLEATIQEDDPIGTIVARRIATAAARTYKRAGDLGRARQWYETALDLRTRIGENPIPGYSNLARISIEMNDLDAAQEYWALSSVGAGSKDKAWSDFELALIAEKQGDREEALRLCESTWAQFIKLGSKSGIQDCQALLQRLRAADGN